MFLPFVSSPDYILCYGFLLPLSLTAPFFFSLQSCARGHIPYSVSSPVVSFMKWHVPSLHLVSVLTAEFYPAFRNRFVTSASLLKLPIYDSRKYHNYCHLVLLVTVTCCQSSAACCRLHPTLRLTVAVDRVLCVIVHFHGFASLSSIQLTCSISQTIFKTILRLCLSLCSSSYCGADVMCILHCGLTCGILPRYILISLIPCRSM